MRGPVLKGARCGEFWNRYAEPNLLLAGNGDGHFVSVTDRAGAFAAHVELSIGLACGDLDGDGDVDLATTDVGHRLRLFRNDAPATGAHWLTVRALAGKRYALGAEVTVVVGSNRFVDAVLRGRGYLSSQDPRVYFGLGASDRVDAIEVKWPNGARELFETPDVDREVTVRRGRGEAI